MITLGTWREGLPKPVTWRWRLTFCRAREERVRLQVEKRPSRRVRKLDDDTLTKDLTGGINYLKGQSFVGANKIGVIGFCWGGGKALLFTTRSKDLAASVIYYGSNPRNLEDVKNITAPVLGQYGGADEPITSAVPQLEEAMKKYGKSFEYKIYPGAPHSFNSDTSPQSYREDAAKEAWGRTLEFFKKNLQS